MSRVIVAGVPKAWPSTFSWPTREGVGQSLRISSRCEQIDATDGFARSPAGRRRAILLTPEFVSAPANEAVSATFGCPPAFSVDGVSENCGTESAAEAEAGAIAASAIAAAARVDLRGILIPDTIAVARCQGLW